MTAALRRSAAACRMPGTMTASTAEVRKRRRRWRTQLRKLRREVDDILIARQDLAKNPRPVTFEVTCRFQI